MTKPTVGLGLVGCGWIAELAHLPSIESSSRGALVAVADASFDRRAWVAARFPSIRVHQTGQDCIHDPGVRAVVVATPPDSHEELAVEALAAGKHVFVEKPLAHSLRSGRAILHAARDRAIRVGVGYNFRRSPAFVGARTAVERGDLGTVLTIQTRFLWAADRISGWRADPARGGGAMLDLASHHFDLVHALTGQLVESVSGRTRSVRTPDDHAVVELRTERGIEVQVLASFVAGTNENSLEIVGDRGSLCVDLSEPRPGPVRRRPGRGYRLGKAYEALQGLHPARLLRSPGFEPSFSATLEAFLRAIQAETDFRPGPEQGLAALAVAEAAAKSARNGGVPTALDPLEEPGDSTRPGKDAPHTGPP